MMKSISPLAGLILGALIGTSAFAQTGQLSQGQVWGNFGASPAPAQPVTLMTFPVVSGDLACFNGTTGKLQDCGVATLPSGLTETGFLTINAPAAVGGVLFKDTTATSLGYWWMHAQNTVFGGVDDYTFGWSYNINPSNPSARQDTTQPAFSWNFEPNFSTGAGGQGLLEHNWSYTSKDGTVSFRPFSFSLNLTTHLPDWDYMGSIHVQHRLNSDFAFVVTPAPSGGGGATVMNGNVKINASNEVAGTNVFTVGGDTGSSTDFVGLYPSVAYNQQNILAITIPTGTYSDYVRPINIAGTVNTGNIQLFAENFSSSGGLNFTMQGNSSSADVSQRFLSPTGDWSIGTNSANGGAWKLSKGGALGTNDMLVAYYSALHLFFGGGTPALTSCGTSPSIVGTDAGGTVTMGTGNPTGCVITFATAYSAAPICTVTWRASPLASQSYASAAATITLTQTATSSNVVDYRCSAQSGG